MHHIFLQKSTGTEQYKSHKFCLSVLEFYFTQDRGLHKKEGLEGRGSSSYG